MDRKNKHTPVSVSVICKKDARLGEAGGVFYYIHLSDAIFPIVVRVIPSDEVTASVYK